MPASEKPLGIYYEGGTVDRHWLAPIGLGISEAKKQRVGRLHKTREGARRAWWNREMERRRAAS